MPLASESTGARVRVDLPPIPAYMQDVMRKERVYVFSVNPKSFERPQGSSGMFIVPARRPEMRVSRAVTHHGQAGIPRIIAETVTDTVEGRRVTQKWDFSTDGMQVARDICGLQYSLEMPENMTRYGLFIAAGPEPTETEIRDAEMARDAEYRRLVLEADNLYRVNGGMETNNGKTMSNISSLHVEAITALGLERPWASGNAPVATLLECEGCGASYKPGVAFCPNGCVVDEEKARKARPWQFQEEKRGPGRPRAEAAA